MSTADLAADMNRTLRDIVLLLRRVSADSEVSAPQLAVMGSLAAGSRRMSELAAEHGVRMPTMTVQVNRLERDGLVVRGSHESDARVVTVALTEAGRVALSVGRRARVGFLAERLEGLAAEDRAAIAAALPALSRLCEKE